MATRKINSAKSIILQCLTEIPDFDDLNPKQKGLVIDRFAKATFTKLMEMGDFKPGEDYINNLSNNKEGADFIITSEKAIEYIKTVLKGKTSDNLNERFVQLELPLDEVA